MEEVKIIEWIKNNSGGGDGYGSGDNYGSGDGYGYGFGYGYGDGYGSGDGYGYGFGYGYGDGSGSGDGYGYGFGDGYGDGSSSGDGYGSGSGDNYGSGFGDGSGFGYGDGYGSGSGDGYGYGFGYGYGDGSSSGDDYGSGDNYGSGSGDGSGYGDGYGYGNKLKSINGDAVFNIDNVPTIIKHTKGNIAKGFIVNCDFTYEPCYIAKGNDYFAHGKTIREAQHGLVRKYIEDMDEDEVIGKFMEEFEPNKKYKGSVFSNWHHYLTGSCLMGRESFVKNHGLNLDDEFTVDEFIELTINNYGGEIIEQLKERWDKLKKGDLIKLETNTNVIHPTHYNQNDRQECWEEMIEIFGADAVIVFDCMNAYKYHYRAGYKLGNPAEQDLEKMKNYINHAEKLVGEYPVTNETLKVFEDVKARLIEESEEEFEKVTRPVIEWLQKNGYPHEFILIGYTSAELLNGEMGYSVEVPD